MLGAHAWYLQLAHLRLVESIRRNLVDPRDNQYAQRLVTGEARKELHDSIARDFDVLFPASIGPRDRKEDGEPTRPLCKLAAYRGGLNRQRLLGSCDDVRKVSAVKRSLN